MLEDSCVGVNDLERVSFHFRAITVDVEPNGKHKTANLFFNLFTFLFIQSNQSNTHC